MSPLAVAIASCNKFQRANQPKISLIVNPSSKTREVETTAWAK